MTGDIFTALDIYSLTWFKLDLTYIYGTSISLDCLHRSVSFPQWEFIK